MIAGKSATVVMASLTLLFSGAIAAQEVTSPPPKITQALELLGDPEVSAWLKANVVAAPAEQPEPVPKITSTTDLMSAWLNQKRGTARRIIEAAPRLLGDIQQALVHLGEGMLGQTWLLILLQIGGALVGGVALEWLLRRASVPFQSRRTRTEVAAKSRIDTLQRLGRDLSGFAGFAIGSIGVYSLLTWPLAIGKIVFTALLVLLAAQLARRLLRYMLIGVNGSSADPNGAIPLAPKAARLWYTRLSLLIAWIAIATIVQSSLIGLGIPDDSRMLLRAILIFVAFAISIELIWRQAGLTRRTEPDSGISSMWSWNWVDRLSHPMLLTGYFVLLWVAMISTMYGAFWLLLLLLTVPWIIRSIKAAFRKADAADGIVRSSKLWRIAFEKLLVAAVLLASGAIVLSASEIGLKEVGDEGSFLPKLIGAATQAIVILLLADLVWHLLSAWLDSSLQRSINSSTPDATRRDAKLRTLLPILRNVLLVFISAVALIMALSAFGVEIGPLLAGAGIVGVAVGFGAQTVVKDIISGMFYLMDDAFRVGEYIQGGSYKGVVEGFSLRSVRLRHHRGPLYTVPFSELGAIENMSRDWVIDKIPISVTYDTDLAKVKKVIKQVGSELLADPELQPHILETLKLQGVEEFGDFSVDLRLKVKTIPGEGQFMVRRRALALIKARFEQAGIQMPYPTVQVASNKELDVATAAAFHANLAQVSKEPV